ncbi:MAG: SDR family NAD(P)-dependent oxidoreductase [Coriobacteriia bacterium]
MKVSGKTIVVTGGGNGIGRELVLNLLDKGARVAAVDMSEVGCAETTTRAGGCEERLSTHVLDITDRSAVEALPASVIEHHGQIDGLINCAGIIQPFVRLKDLDYEAIERVMNVNFWGVVNMTKTFLPLLLARPQAHIVNISSMGGFAPVPGQTIYGASKAAVKLLTEGLYAECIGTSVSVTVAFPGAIATDISKNSGVGLSAEESAASGKAPKIKMTSPVDAARIIVDAMERDAFRVTVGPDATMLDRLARLAPKKAAEVIQKQMKDLLPD